MQSPIRAERILGSRSKLGVLRQLFGVSAPLSTLEIARRAGMSQPAAAAALSELSRYGLVQSTLAGRAWVHSLVWESEYVRQMVSPVLRAEQELPEQMVRDVATRFAADAVAGVVFGSYARDEATPDSDLDLVLVGRDSSHVERLNTLAESVQARIRQAYGVRLSVLTYSAAEAAALTERAPALMTEIEREGIVLFGPSPWKWGELADA